MNSGHDLAGLMKFAGRAEWAEAFQAVLAEHFSGGTGPEPSGAVPSRTF